MKHDMSKKRKSSGPSSGGVWLKDWVFRFAYKKEEFPHDSSIYLEGAKESDGERWRSSVIVKRVDGRTLQTASGSSYHLVGPIDRVEAKMEGLSKVVIKKFNAGFPKDWKSIIEGFVLDTYGNGSSKENQNPDDQMDVVAEKKKKKNQTTKTKQQQLLANKTKKQPRKPSVLKDKQTPVVEGGKTITQGNTPKVAVKKEKDQATTKSSTKAIAKRTRSATGNAPKPKPQKTGDDGDGYRSSSTGSDDGSTSSGVDDDDEFVLETDKKTRGIIDSDSEYSSGNERRRRVVDDSSDESADEWDWSADENRALRRAHSSTNPGCPRFWEKVASMVPGRSAQECYDQWFRVFTQPLEAIQNRRKMKPKAAQSKVIGKPAGRNTARFRQQIRTMFEESEKNHKDDLFQSTPYKKRDVKKFVFDTEMQTPKPKKQKGDDDDDDDDDEDMEDADDEDENDLEQVNRDKADLYIAGISNKRRKALNNKKSKKQKAKPSNLVVTKPKQQQSKIVSDHGVQGKVTPGGTVKVKYTYSFSDEDEDDDEEEEEEDLV